MEAEHPDHPALSEERHSPTLTWGIITGIAVAFLIWGLSIYFLLGDKGPPDWDFSVIPDIPAESAYSTHPPHRPHGLVPDPYPAQVDPQHIMGPATQSQKMEIPQ
jgi:hypothetical protein